MQTNSSPSKVNCCSEETQKKSVDVQHFLLHKICSKFYYQKKQKIAVVMLLPLSLLKNLGSLRFVFIERDFFVVVFVFSFIAISLRIILYIGFWGKQFVLLQLLCFFIGYFRKKRIKSLPGNLRVRRFLFWMCSNEAII